MAAYNVLLLSLVVSVVPLVVEDSPGERGPEGPTDNTDGVSSHHPQSQGPLRSE